MPRKLRLFLQQGGEPIWVTLRKISREALYGTKTVEKRLEDGAVLDRVPVTQDGSHFLPPGSLSQEYQTEGGAYAPKVIPTDAEGKPLPLQPDMFTAGGILERKIALEDFFEYNFSRVYLLNDAGQPGDPAWEVLKTRCVELLKENQFLVFKYIWRSTAFPEDAVIVPAEDGNVFVLVGTRAPVAWARLNTNLAQIFTEAEQEGQVEEFDFDYW